MKLLTLDHLQVGYQRNEVAVEVSVSIESGSKVGLVGLNGSGKTTLLLGIAGAIHNLGGSIRLAGLEISGAPAFKRRLLGIGSLLQNRFVFPGEPVDCAVRFLTLSGGPVAFQKAQRILSDLGFRHLLDKDRSESLSLGEQKAVAFASLLGTEPRVFLIDELDAGLAKPVRDGMYGMISEYLRQSQACVLFATHDLDHADQYADNIIALRVGHISAQIPPRSNRVEGDLWSAVQPSEEV